MLNIRLNLSALRRGPGRRRLPEAYAAARAEIVELNAEAATTAAKHAAEIKGYQDGLREAGKKYNAIVEDRTKLKAAYDWHVDEVKRLNRVLGASDGQPTVAVPALADEPGSFTAVPDPAPLPDFRISNVPPGPTGEAADVNARTQLTDVRSLRQALTATAIPDAGPVHVPWGAGGPSTRPPMPDEAPTQRFSAVTAVLPIWDQSIPVPVELSKATGDRARESVHAAVGGAA